MLYFASYRAIATSFRAPEVRFEITARFTRRQRLASRRNAFSPMIPITAAAPRQLRVYRRRRLMMLGGREMPGAIIAAAEAVDGEPISRCMAAHQALSDYALSRSTKRSVSSAMLTVASVADATSGGPSSCRGQPRSRRLTRPSASRRRF